MSHREKPPVWWHGGSIAAAEESSACCCWGSATNSGQWKGASSRCDLRWRNRSFGLANPRSHTLQVCGRDVSARCVDRCVARLENQPWHSAHWRLRRAGPLGVDPEPPARFRRTPATTPAPLLAEAAAATGMYSSSELLLLLASCFMGVVRLAMLMGEGYAVPVAVAVAVVPLAPAEVAM